MDGLKSRKESGKNYPNLEVRTKRLTNGISPSYKLDVLGTVSQLSVRDTMFKGYHLQPRAATQNGNHLMIRFLIQEPIYGVNLLLSVQSV